MKKLFWKAIGELSDVQRKRLLLYYDYGFSLKEIAFIENCPIHVIEYSIDIAKEIRRKNKKF